MIALERNDLLKGELTGKNRKLERENRKYEREKNSIHNETMKVKVNCE